MSIWQDNFRKIVREAQEKALQESKVEFDAIVAGEKPMPDNVSDEYRTLIHSVRTGFIKVSR